jgi:hypothetical protein
MALRWFVVAGVLLSALGHAAPQPKKKVAPKVVAPPAASELKKEPSLAPVQEAPAAQARTAPAAAVVAEAPEPELMPLPRLSPLGGWSLQAAGGILAPLNGLRLGGRGELRVARWFQSVPLAVSFGVAFEQHASRSAAFFAPPAGGLDLAALDNQTLLPFEVGVLAALFRDEKNRVHVGASYALLAVWSQTVALGDSVLERGVGHEVGGEAGYTRRVGALELTVRVRYSVRRTAVGFRTASIELPWYQAFGVVAGVGLFL